jgi:peptidoglycan DL-endopeptidase CwlO
MSNGKIIIGIGLVAGAGIALWYAFRPTSAPTSSAGGSASVSESQPASTFTERFSSSLATAYEQELMSWTTPKAGQIFETTFQAATIRYGLPPGLLSRVAYQESRYNPKAKSPAGALGLMQFMPATAKDFGIDPWNPEQSIWAAAQYLSQLYKRFGNWKEAVAAYNWGQGNVAKKGLEKAPSETRNYFAQILGDIGLTV